MTLLMKEKGWLCHQVLLNHKLYVHQNFSIYNNNYADNFFYLHTELVTTIYRVSE